MLKKENLLASILVITMLLVCALGVNASSKTYKLTIMATTDMHQHLVPYDYMSDKAVDNYGFAKTYTLIKKVRENNPNTILLSDGDVISGSLISTLEARIDPLKQGETPEIVKIYNAVGYDAATVGNHELQDYDTSYFMKALERAKFPWLSANIRLANKNKLFVKPYTIIKKNIDGKILKIGVIGFTPPQTMQWGKTHLQGKVEIDDILTAAKKYIPIVREKADLVVVLAHTGISTADKNSYTARENAGYYLSQIKGIDAIILGHAHNALPGDDYKNIKGIDNEKGTINGVPAVMAESWGRALGVIDLNLVYDNNSWKVKSGSSKLLLVDKNVPASPKITKMAEKISQKTIAYVRKPLGKTQRDITSYLSRVMDSSVTQVVNNAQIWWAKEIFAKGEYSNLPILSAAAPFQASLNDPKYYTDVNKGDITIGDVTDIYIYANEIRVMKLNGKQVISWLERSADNFNQIDPNKSGEQKLLNSKFPAFNFDVIDGINYEIDVTKPKGERIVNATYQGKPLTGNREFLVVTNDYRAGGGGNFPPCVKEDPVYSPSGVTNRTQIINYIKVKGTIDPKPTYNWRIKPINVKGTVIFTSTLETANLIKKYNIKGIELLRKDKNGMGVYEINLAQ